MDQDQQRDYADEAATRRDARDETTRAARELTCGDVIMMCGYPEATPGRVTYVQHNADGTITVVLSSGASTLTGPDDRFDIGTEADVRAATDREHRRNVAHMLAHVAELIVTRDLPLGNYPMFNAGVVDDEAAVARWGAVLDLPVEDGGTPGLIPSIDTHALTDTYLGVLGFHVQARRTP